MSTTDSSSTQAGLSLLGVLVAVIILSAGALALTQLMARTQHTVGLAREKFMAALAAQEALELLQAQRDTNWLAHDAAATGDCATNRQGSGRDECWVESICGSDGKDASATHGLIIDRDVANGITIIHEPTTQQQQLYVADTGYWSHAVSAQRSPYQRLVTVDCSMQASEPAFITATAQVRWQSRGREQNVTVSERLYNWYKEN